MEEQKKNLLLLLAILVAFAVLILWACLSRNDSVEEWLFTLISKFREATTQLHCSSTAAAHC